MKILLDKSKDPMRILTHQKWLIESIIGNENIDCIRIFKFLISSSVTPVGWQKRGIKFKKSPKNLEK
jgi:NIMA (never in mitosis gene a)-related kinase